MSTPLAAAPSVAAPAPTTASHKRAAQPAFAQWALRTLAPQLPLRFPVPADVLRSPKQRYRSQYRPVSRPALPDPADLTAMSDFELALHLIDFSPLEALLAQHYRSSRKGQVPFHPVSLFLAVCLRRELVLSWVATARLLAGDHGGGWRSLLGFAAGATPSASGLRFFFLTPKAEVKSNHRRRQRAEARALDPRKRTYL